MNSNLSKNDTYTVNEALKMFWALYKKSPSLFNIQGYYNDEPFLIREMIVNAIYDNSFTPKEYQGLVDDFMGGNWTDNSFDKTKIHDLIYIFYKVNSFLPSVVGFAFIPYFTIAIRLYKEAYNICIDKFHNAVKNTDYNEILRVLNSLDKQEIGTLVDGVTVALALPSSNASSTYTNMITQYFLGHLLTFSKHNTDIPAFKTDKEYRQMRSYMRRFANLLTRALKQAHDNNPQAFFDNETNELYSVYVDPDMSVLNADSMFRTTCINELKSTLIFNPPIFVEYKYPILLHKWEKKE
jgi:hypothetical protein